MHSLFIFTVLIIVCTVNGYRGVTNMLKRKITFNRDISLYGVPPEIVDRSYNLAAGSAVLGTVFGALENFKGPTARLFGGGAIAFTLFGGFLAYQTTTLRFQFDETTFSLVKADSSKIGENIVVGGENSWSYDSFVNWDFLPDEKFPILVYFKETQTPRDKWVEAPIVVDNLEGQAHFFPAIADIQQLKTNFIKYKCKKVINNNQATTVKLTPKIVI